MSDDKEKCKEPCDSCCKYGGFRVDPNERPNVATPPHTPDQMRPPPAFAPPPVGLPEDIGVNIDYKKTLPHGDPECYLPQRKDMPGQQVSSGEAPMMGPIGPWATGRVDWGPLAGLTGTRPVVSKYSITRYSEGEWRQRNKEVLDQIYGAENKANLINYKSDQCLQKGSKDIEKLQEDNSKLIYQRSIEVHRWKCELERAIEAAIEELSYLDEDHTRLKHAGKILTIPESIASECLDLRTTRFEPDLVRDEVEEELIKELALTAEIRSIFDKALIDLKHQITQQFAARQRLEVDWSDKSEAHNVEMSNYVLNAHSTVLMFKPGSARIPDNQATFEYWQHFTRESLYQGEQTRQTSITFRSRLTSILQNAARDLRSQADLVDRALSRSIACKDELKNKYERELRRLLDQLVETENTIAKLKKAIRSLDQLMKLAHTRLDNKTSLPRVENCRDPSAFGVLKEVEVIGKRVAEFTSELNQAELCKADLLKTRGDLERELMVRLKGLFIDAYRIKTLRSHYPSAAELSGN